MDTPTSHRVLVVDDDLILVRLLERVLVRAGYSVETAFNGTTGLEKALKPGLSLVILDLILPPTSGIEVLKKIRLHSPGIPILILSAREEIKVRVQALKLGADDYLIKPFNHSELLARLEALLRRSTGKDLLLTAGDLTLSVTDRTASRAGKSIMLSPTEFRLLEFLLRNKNAVMTREAIIERVWGYDFDPGTNILSVYISYLRKAIDEGYEQKLLRTVRGQGFMIEDKVELEREQ
jgi:DNA-binding response OmpR family regulator